ncbi:MAG: allophanate hydrolase [Flavobacteriaceae bacterium]|nr:allophanate hydrolase [Flavobacteriaceae bacterium]|tara:strand:+ start:43753 stop:44589 length:837 start_codon:yes stop_codon:yes gene_type:complete
MIEVLHPGLWTSIQDKGRYGYRKIGVPLSGAMDQVAAAAANKILDNDPNAAVLECTFMGPKLRFHHETCVAMTGAPFPMTLNGTPLQNKTLHRINSGDTLTFGTTQQGRYGYLAVKGGITTEVIMGSRSQYPGITKRVRLQKGDQLSIGIDGTLQEEPVYQFEMPSEAMVIPATPGPEFGLLSAEAQRQLTEQWFPIHPQSNRMAFVLESEKPIRVPEIITGPVQPGTVQITPSGRCMVLMRDCQTTGGYGRVLQLPESSINTLSQVQPKSKIRFQLE